MKILLIYALLFLSVAAMATDHELSIDNFDEAQKVVQSYYFNPNIEASIETARERLKNIFSIHDL